MHGIKVDSAVSLVPVPVLCLPWVLRWGGQAGTHQLQAGIRARAGVTSSGKQLALLEITWGSGNSSTFPGDSGGNSHPWHPQLPVGKTLQVSP